MNKLPLEIHEAIYADRDLATGQYLKSQFVIECLNSLGNFGNASGIYFPSRRTDGNVLVFNPHIVEWLFIFTGQSLPSENFSMFYQFGYPPTFSEVASI